MTVVSTAVRISDETLGGINSYADAIAVLAEVGISVENASDYGNGFVVVDKKELINRPFLIIEWRFNQSDKYGGDFVSVEAVTESGDKIVFNDGSTGVRDQLKAIEARRAAAGIPQPAMGLMCGNGLVAKDFTPKETDGTPMMEKGKPLVVTIYRIAF